MTPAFARLWCLAFGHAWVPTEPAKCYPQECDPECPGDDEHARCSRCSRCAAERGPGYVAWVVYPGHCVVEGCTREALTFCDEHKPKAKHGRTG